jgi:hypothetical protein
MNTHIHSIIADTIRQLQESTEAAEALLHRALAGGADRDLERAAQELLPLVYRIEGFAALARGLARNFPPEP